MINTFSTMRLLNTTALIATSSGLPFNNSTKKERRASAASGSTAGRESPASSSSAYKNKQERIESVYDEKILWFPAKRELPIIMNSIEDDTDCILCCDVMLDPVTLPCGHSVCQVCLAKAFLSSHHHSLCPVCRLQWSTVPPINYCLRSVIEKMFPRKLAERRAKSNTWGTADADVLREFERCMRTRAVLKDNAASAARFRLALWLFGALTALCLVGLLTSVMLAILTQSEPPMVGDNVVLASTFASSPNFVDLQADRNIVRAANKARNFRQLDSSSNLLPFIGGAASEVDGVNYSLADRFIQRNWLPPGRIDQWKTSDVVKFLNNAGLLHGSSGLLQQRLENLKINGSTLLRLREHNVWDSNGLNITQPGTYHAFMMMVYGLRNLLVANEDPLAMFCARGAVNCVYIMLSFYAAPHLFWFYAFVFQYNRYFSMLTSSPQCESVLSNWLASLLFFTSSDSAVCSSTTKMFGSGWQSLLTALTFPRFSMITVFVEHYRGHPLTFTAWAVIFIGTWKLLSSAYKQWHRLVVELPRSGLSETIGKTLASFARKSAIVFMVTLTAWLMPVLCCPIIYAATSYEMVKILLKVVLYTEKVVRGLLSYSRTERDNDADADNINNNNLMQVAENPAVAVPDENNRNGNPSPSANAARRTSSSQLVLPSIDADILARMGILNQRDPSSSNSNQPLQQQRTPVRTTLSNISGRSLSSGFYRAVESSSSNGGATTVNSLRHTVRQSRAHYLCR